MKPTIFPIKAFSDNYIWCIHNQNMALIVDPGNANNVIYYLQQNNLQLKTILITHHHYDHIDGVQELSQKYNCDVIKPNDPRIPDYKNQQIVDQSDVIRLNYLNLKLKVLMVPGHTLSHIAYYNEDLLFCGDTLFSLGCGRMFEGTAEQMSHSLKQLKQLPNKTLVYCTHEYTKSNLDFSLSLLPNDLNLLAAKASIMNKLNQNQPTLPSSIGFENKNNLFFRTNDSDLITRLKSKGFENLDNEVAVFAALRQLKDEF